MVDFIAEIAPALLLLCGACYLAFIARRSPVSPFVGGCETPVARGECWAGDQSAVNVELCHEQRVLLRYESSAGRHLRVWMAVQSVAAVVRSGPKAVGEETDASKGLCGHLAIRALGVPWLVGVLVLVANIGGGMLWRVEVPGAHAAVLVVIASSAGLMGMPLLQLLGVVRVSWTSESMSCCFMWRRSCDTYVWSDTSLSFGIVNAWGFQKVRVLRSEGRKRTFLINGVQAIELADVSAAQHLGTGCGRSAGAVLCDGDDNSPRVRESPLEEK